MARQTRQRHWAWTRVLSHVPPPALASLLVVLWSASPAAAAQERDPLAHPRALYNERRFAEAIALAEEARVSPLRADSADVISARAYLERYRENHATDDLTAARERLRGVDPQRLGVRERVEFLVGLGEALFLEA